MATNTNSISAGTKTAIAPQGMHASLLRQQERSFAKAGEIGRSRLEGLDSSRRLVASANALSDCELAKLSIFLAGQLGELEAGPKPQDIRFMLDALNSESERRECRQQRLFGLFLGKAESSSSSERVAALQGALGTFSFAAAKSRHFEKAGYDSEKAMELDYKSALAAVKALRKGGVSYNASDVTVLSSSLASLKLPAEGMRYAGFFLSALINCSQEKKHVLLFDPTATFEGGFGANVRHGNNSVCYRNSKNVLIVGNVGNYAGSRMQPLSSMCVIGSAGSNLCHNGEGGSAVVSYSAGPMAGSFLHDGRILLLGQAEGDLGHGMSGGTIVSRAYSPALESGEDSFGERRRIASHAQGGELHLHGSYNSIDASLMHKGKIYINGTIVVDKGTTAISFEDAAAAFALLRERLSMQVPSASEPLALVNCKSPIYGSTYSVGIYLGTVARAGKKVSIRQLNGEEFDLPPSAYDIDVDGSNQTLYSLLCAGSISQLAKNVVFFDPGPSADSLLKNMQGLLLSHMGKAVPKTSKGAA